jgi:hypothetical protein
MFARHAWNAPLADSLYLSYHAKRKAQVAPGVGEGTDMVVVGPALGAMAQIDPATMDTFEAAYQTAVQAEEQGFSSAKMAINQYVTELNRKAAEATQPQQQPTTPKTNGGAPSSNGA